MKELDYINLNVQDFRIYTLYFVEICLNILEIGHCLLGSQMSSQSNAKKFLMVLKRL